MAANMSEQGGNSPWELGRRDFLINSVAAASATVAAGTVTNTLQSAELNMTPKPLSISLTINGQSKSISIDPRTTLVDLLREDLNLTGTKKGCDHGACGACTVLLNGERVLSCLTLAATLADAKVQTIEGLAQGDNLHPLQEQFLECDAFQCGYCTPGQIMSGLACIREGHATGDVEETREWMSGNLCRCSAYPNIVDAVRKAAAATL